MVGLLEETEAEMDTVHNSNNDFPVKLNILKAVSEKV